MISQILQSGGTSTAPLAPTGEAWNDVYSLIVSSTGCNVTAAAGNGTSSNATANSGNYSSSFECLKYTPADKLLAAQAAIQSNIRYSSSFVFGTLNFPPDGVKGTKADIQLRRLMVILFRRHRMIWSDRVNSLIDPLLAGMSRTSK